MSGRLGLGRSGQGMSGRFGQGMSGRSQSGSGIRNASRASSTAMMIGTTTLATPTTVWIAA